MSGVRHIGVSEDDNGQRLDRWLKKQGLPFALVQKLLRTGQIRVDGKRAKPDQKLAAGQDVRLPPVEEKPRKELPLSQKDVEFIHSLVIYDDGQVLAVNKPYDLPSQGGPGIRRHVDGLLEGLKDGKGVKPRLVHRLDRETSGVMLLARSAETARALGKAFQGRDVQKIYRALTVPAPEIDDGTITAPLHKLDRAQKVIVDEKEGKTAITDFRVIERVGRQCAYVAFRPRTGRMHQIRAHAAFMGCPLLGDVRYGGAEHLDGMKTASRLHLHAWRIVLPHPCKKGILEVTAPLPADLKKSWKALGFESGGKADPFADIVL